MPEDFQLDPESLASLERATQAAEEDAIFARLFTPPEPTPLSPEEQEIYDRLFGPPKPTPLSPEDRDTYEALYGPENGGDAA